MLINIMLRDLSAVCREQILQRQLLLEETQETHRASQALMFYSSSYCKTCLTVMDENLSHIITSSCVSFEICRV